MEKLTKPMIFIPSKDDKILAQSIAEKFIDLVESHPLEFRAFVLQMLLETFEDTYNIDVRNGISIKDTLISKKEKKQ